MGIDDIIAALIGVCMVMFTVFVHYEIMLLTWRSVRNNLSSIGKAHRSIVIKLVLFLFTAHTISVWAYGLVYWLMSEFLQIGALVGVGIDEDTSFMTYIYFSAATYSSLGLGDIYPMGAFRMITGIEVLNGLLLIGWSVSITYLTMEKVWDNNSKGRVPVKQDR